MWIRWRGKQCVSEGPAMDVYRMSPNRRRWLWARPRLLDCWDMVLITQCEFGALVIRSVHSRLRRFATALAVVAALALVLNGALGSNHHLSAAAGHHHGEPHSHGADAHVHSHAAPIADHQLANDDVSHGVDVAAVDFDGALAFSPDADANDYLNACSAAVVLPCPSTHALPFLFFGTLIAAHPRRDKGVIPDGLRRPPRRLAIT